MGQTGHRWAVGTGTEAEWDGTVREGSQGCGRLHRMYGIQAGQNGIPSVWGWNEGCQTQNENP